MLMIMLFLLAEGLAMMWLRQPQAETFGKMLPELGVNGSLANACKECPARGKVFAKTGTVALPDFSLPHRSGKRFGQGRKARPETVQSIVEELNPEAAYFTDMDGARGGYLIINMVDASQIPAMAEPLFLGSRRDH